MLRSRRVCLSRGRRPGMGTTATSNGDEAPDPQQPNAPATSLPQSKPTAPTPDEGAAPEVPARVRARRRLPLPSVQTNFVEVPFTVKDKSGKLVPGLTWRDVRVYENGLRQQMSALYGGSVAAVGGAGDRPEPDVRQHGEGERCHERAVRMRFHPMTRLRSLRTTMGRRCVLTLRRDRATG